ncbi:hypothetical protein H6764_00550 [Candidatus Nomurabacteria bacterium]|nr:hypothetical protein [Candidatus Nomurabacteria bacterium]
MITSIIVVPSSVSAQETTAVDTNSVPTYVLYVHEDCPHCKKVEAFIADNNLEDQVDSRELKNNDKHMKELEALWDEFNLPDNERGWPFMLIDDNGDRSYVSGDSPIIAELGNTFGISVPNDSAGNSSTTTSSSNTSTADTLLLVLGGVVVFAIVGYAVYSSINDSKK